MTSRYAEVIGDPIDHSLSPAIHAFWLERSEIDAEYRRHRVGRGELKAYLDERRADSAWLGCNVTMPLKLDALALADQASDRALGTGAANLLVPRDGKIIAGNTDSSAVAKLVGGLAAAGAPMDGITLLGTGGAARAALMGLHLLGITAVRIQSRDLGEAFKLAVQYGLDFEPVPFDAPVATAGLINATPLGMRGQLPIHVDFSRMPANGWLFDFVTSPNPTELVSMAAERGLITITGIDMLIEQAADSFALLFGTEPQRDSDDQLRQRLAA